MISHKHPNNGIGSGQATPGPNETDELEARKALQESMLPIAQIRERLRIAPDYQHSYEPVPWEKMGSGVPRRGPVPIQGYYRSYVDRPGDASTPMIDTYIGGSVYEDGDLKRENGWYGRSHAMRYVRTTPKSYYQITNGFPAPPISYNTRSMVLDFSPSRRVKIPHTPVPSMTQFTVYS